MFKFLKRLVREPLPPHIHFHVDDAGKQIWCDESRCRPARTAQPFGLPPIRY
jgi:hypothetical protein